MRLILIGLLFCISQINVSFQTLSLQPITAQNAAHLQEIERLGRGTANALDWHPDGKLLAVASSTGVWLLDENLQIIRQSPIQENISGLAWSPNGRYLAITSNVPDQCSIQVWVADFSEREFNADLCGSEIRWSSDSLYIAVFNHDLVANEMQLIDLVENTVTQLPGQIAAWSPNSDILFTRLTYTTSFSGIPMLYTWDASTKEQLFAYELSQEQFGSLLWGIDDRSVAIRCAEFNEESSVYILNLCNMDARTGAMNTIEHIGSVQEGQCSCDSKFHLNTDGTLLTYVHDSFTRGFLSFIAVLDTVNNETRKVGDGNIFAWKPHSNTLTSIVGNGELRTYDVETSTTISQSNLFTAPLNMIALRPNSHDIASSSFGYEQVSLIWDWNESIHEPKLTFYIEPAESVFYTPSGDELIAGGTIGTDVIINQNIDVVDPDTGAFIRDVQAFYDQDASPPRRYWNADYTKYIEVNEEGIPVLPNGIQLPIRNLLYVAWSPNEAIIATVALRDPNDYTFVVNTWSVADGHNINTYVSGMFAYRGLVWSPNSQQIAVILEHPTGSSVYVRGLRVFSVIESKTYDFDQNDFEIFEDMDVFLYDGPQTQAAWNNDGTMLAVALSNRLQIFQVGSDQPLVTQPAYRVASLQWSSNNQFIASGSQDGTITIWGITQQ